MTRPTTASNLRESAQSADNPLDPGPLRPLHSATHRHACRSPSVALTGAADCRCRFLTIAPPMRQTRHQGQVQHPDRRTCQKRATGAIPAMNQTAHKRLKGLRPTLQDAPICGHQLGLPAAQTSQERAKRPQSPSRKRPPAWSPTMPWWPSRSSLPRGNHATRTSSSRSSSTSSTEATSDPKYRQGRPHWTEHPLHSEPETGRKQDKQDMLRWLRATSGLVPLAWRCRHPPGGFQRSAEGPAGAKPYGGR